MAQKLLGAALIPTSVPFTPPGGRCWQRWGWPLGTGVGAPTSHFSPRILTLEVQQRCAEAQVGMTCPLSAAVGLCVFAVGGAKTHGGWGRCHPGVRMSLLYIVHPALFKDVFWTYLGHSRQISSIHFKITSLNSNMLSKAWLTALVFEWELHKRSFSQQKAVNLRAYDGDKSLWPLANSKWLQTTGHPLPSASYKPNNYTLALMLVSSVQRLVELAGAHAVLATGSFFCKYLKP